jgi:DNA-directed RNA polymerase specialized sigma24 family protein
LRSVFKRFRQKKAEGRQVDIDQAVTRLASDPETEQVWDDEWRQHHLRVAMNTVRVEFNRNDVAAFESYVGEGAGAQETAEALGMSVDQVYQAKSRIMKRLAQLIEQQTLEEG